MWDDNDDNVQAQRESVTQECTVEERRFSAA
jgi:hypothetical protein